MAPGRLTSANKSFTPQRTARILKAEASRQAVFNTTELLESMLMQLPVEQLFAVQGVNKKWKTCIENSSALQKKMWLCVEGLPKEKWTWENDWESFWHADTFRALDEDHETFMKATRMIKLPTDIQVQDLPHGRTVTFTPLNLNPMLSDPDWRKERHFGDVHAKFLKHLAIPYESRLECNILKSILSNPPCPLVVVDLRCLVSDADGTDIALVSAEPLVAYPLTIGDAIEKALRTVCPPGNPVTVDFCTAGSPGFYVCAHDGTTLAERLDKFQKHYNGKCKIFLNAMPTSANIKYAWYPRNGSLEFRLVDAVRVQEGEWADVHARHDASPYYASKELPGLGWAWVDELEDSYLEAVPILFGQYEDETKSQES